MFLIPAYHSISVQTHQSLMLIDINFIKIWKHPDGTPQAAFACSTISRLRVQTQLVRTGHFLSDSSENSFTFPKMYCLSYFIKHF